MKIWFSRIPYYYRLESKESNYCTVEHLVVPLHAGLYMKSFCLLNARLYIERSGTH